MMHAELPVAEPSNFRSLTIGDDRRTFTLCRARKDLGPGVLFLVKVNGHCQVTSPDWPDALERLKGLLDRYGSRRPLSFFSEGSNG